jgi:hypothetical protein
MPFKLLRVAFPMNPRLTAASFLGAALLAGSFSGCVDSYKVKVDSLAKPTAENAIAYQIKVASPSIDPESLRYKEAEKFVKTALSGKGLYEAPKPEMADMVVSVDYGISPPKITQEPHSEPIYREVPGAIVEETIRIGTDKSGNPVYRTVVTQGPSTTEYVGEREYVITVVTYEKYLRLSARENAPASEGRPPADVWSVDITTEGESHDLRKALPVLAAASIDYIGKDTRGQKVIKLKDTKDGSIAFVKKGM